MVWSWAFAWLNAEMCLAAAEQVHGVMMKANGMMVGDSSSEEAEMDQ